MELPKSRDTLSLPLNLLEAQIELKLVVPSPIFLVLLASGIIFPVTSTPPLVVLNFLTLS